MSKAVTFLETGRNSNGTVHREKQSRTPDDKKPGMKSFFRHFEGERHFGGWYLLRFVLRFDQQQLGVFLPAALASLFENAE